MLLGAHFTVNNGMLHALKQAQSHNLEVIQIFGYRRHQFYFDPGLDANTKKMIEDEINDWHKSLALTAIKQVIVHSRFVAALTSDSAIRIQELIDKLKAELELARMIKAQYFVFHPGPFGLEMDVKSGLNMARDVLKNIVSCMGKDDPVLVLENMAGGGRRMGGTIEELGFIVDGLKEYGDKFGVCMDLAHLWGAGYDIRTEQTARAFFKDLFKWVPKEKVFMFHLNNTRVELGSHRDDHFHLESGQLDKSLFAYLMKEWPDTIGVLETPKEPEGADKKNLDFLRSL
ncbi:deoxyribonuclease IV [Elusimicrobiota bacterium]